MEINVQPVDQEHTLRASEVQVVHLVQQDNSQLVLLIQVVLNAQWVHITLLLEVQHVQPVLLEKQHHQLVQHQQIVVQIVHL